MISFIYLNCHWIASGLLDSTLIYSKYIDPFPTDSGRVEIRRFHSNTKYMTYSKFDFVLVKLSSEFHFENSYIDKRK